MKIAFLNIYSGLVNRGVERSISELAKRLSKNHQVKVFQGESVKAVYPIHMIKLNLDLSRINQTTILRKRFLLILSYGSRKVAEFTIKSLSFLWREKYDVIIPTNGGWQSLMCRILTWLQGTKMVIAGRSGPGWDERVNLLMRPDIFVALTPAHQKWAEKYYPKNKIRQIPNGVDLKKFSSSIKPLKVDLPKPIILTVGAITPWKRHELVLEAIAGLKNVSWLLVGDGVGNYKEQIIKQASQKLGRRFFHLNFPLEKMPQVYRTAQVFTSAVRPEEAFGNVFLEALASNLPVVTSSDPSRKYIVGEAGIFVDPTVPNSYTQALREALNIKWGNAPREQTEKFSWDKVVNSYEKLFNEL